MPSIVQFTDLNIKQMQQEERERMENRMEDKDIIRGQLEDRKRTRDRLERTQDLRAGEAKGRDRNTGDDDEDRQSRMRIATIAALAEEIRRRRIVRGPGTAIGGGGENRTVKEDPGTEQPERFKMYSTPVKLYCITGCKQYRNINFRVKRVMVEVKYTTYIKG